jgi:hypothetical protein
MVYVYKIKGGYMNFKEWLNESKGIRIPDDVDGMIEKLVDSIILIIPGVKDNIGSEKMVVDNLEVPSPYGRPMLLDVWVVNYPNINYHANLEGLPLSISRTLNINVAHTDKSKMTNKWVRRLLWHELGVHARDPKINSMSYLLRQDVNKGTSDLGGSDYFHDPKEFDAYSGQIVHAIIKFAKNNKDNPEHANKMLDDSLAWMRNPKEAVRNGQGGVFGDKEWFNVVMQYWGNPALKKRLLDRLYNAIMAGKKIVNGVL